MLTLNRLITEIQTFVTNHDALNTFVFGDPWEQAAKSDIKYPLLFCMIEPSTVEGTSETFTLSVTICDLERTDKTNTVRILSDCKRYCNDFITYFAQANFTDDFQLDETLTFDPFVESFNDNCAGWTFLANFKQPFRWDLCSVPYTGAPTE